MSPARYLAGLLTIDFDHKHSIGRILPYGSTANFLFLGPIAKIYISKEREGYSVRSGPRISEIEQVIRKLSRFSQVQSERERTLIMIILHFYHYHYQFCLSTKK